MKKKANILFIALLIALMIGCDNKSKEQEKKSWEILSVNPDIETLINFLIKFPESKRQDLIYKKLDSLIILWPHTSLINMPVKIDQENNLLLEFVDKGDDTAGDYYLRERNAYLLTLDNTNRGITHNGKPVNFTEVSNDLRNKFFEWEREDSTTQRKVDEIKYFGFVLVSKIIVVIDLKESPTNINWHNYLKCIEQVFSVYQNIWNDKSIEIWDKKFENLEISKKEALLEMYPFGMELNFIKRTFIRK